MQTPREPLFLARQNYRKRRFEDAARFLPLLGAFLFLLPLLSPGGSIVSRSVYVFGVWVCLILCAAFLSNALSRKLPVDDAVAPKDGRGDQDDGRDA